LELLTEGDHSVGRMAELLGMEISHLSHQLAVLRRAGLVNSRREGSAVFYTLRQPHLVHLLTLVAGEVLWDSTGDPDPSGP
jgi:ArsR family transcriptional regulator